MEKQLDDIETVNNEGAKEGEPQMSEDVPVAREDLPSEILIHPSDDGPDVQSDSKDETIDQLMPEYMPESQTELPISQDTSQDVSTPDDENDTPNPDPRRECKKKKGKEPVYSNTTPRSFESPAGPSTTTPDQPFQLLSNNGVYGSRASNQPLPWELDPERPAQKQPIYFKDAVGREYIIPWRRARTWEGMKMTIDAAFEKIGGMLGINVAAGHYDLSFTTASIEEDVVPDPLSPGPKQKPAIAHAQLPRPLVVHPDFWEELICPGMDVSMAMWPMEAFAALNLRGSRPTATQGGRGLVGNQAFNNIVNVGPPPLPPQGFINIVPPVGRSSRRKAKTRVNPGRPVAKP